MAERLTRDQRSLMGRAAKDGFTPRSWSSEAACQHLLRLGMFAATGSKYVLTDAGRKELTRLG